VRSDPTPERPGPAVLLRLDAAFEWLGRLVLPGLFDGRHRFELVPDGDGTRLVHTERFTGLLVPLLKKSLDTKTIAGFRAMNTALKARAEARDVASA